MGALTEPGPPELKACGCPVQENFPVEIFSHGMLNPTSEQWAIYTFERE